MTIMYGKIGCRLRHQIQNAGREASVSRIDKQRGRPTYSRYPQASNRRSTPGTQTNRFLKWRQAQFHALRFSCEPQPCKNTQERHIPRHGTPSAGVQLQRATFNKAGPGQQSWTTTSCNGLAVPRSAKGKRALITPAQAGEPVIMIRKQE